MRDVKMTTSFVAPLARRDKTTIYQWFNTPECQAWLPPKTGVGESRTFTQEEAVLLMVHSDLNRWGIPVPMAGRLVAQIAEKLEPHWQVGMGPYFVSIGFCENGASFCEPACARLVQDERRFISTGAGELRFIVEINLDGYRKTVREAVDAEPQVIGGDDGE